MTRSTTRRRAAILFGIGAIATAGLMPAGASTSQEGSLDTSFNGTGIKTTFVASTDDQINALAVQPDGKIVAVGNESHLFYSDWVVLRFNPDGSLDNTFDGDGIVVGNFTATLAGASAVAIQPDGKIVLAGSAEVSGTSLDFAVARYLANGMPDNTFGGDGVVTTNLGNTINGAAAIALRPDGKIVAAGRSGDGGNSNQFAVVRYNSDGSLDSTFDGDGIALTPMGQSDGASALSVQGDGKVVVAGDTVTGNSYAFAAVRYTVNGALDTTFGPGHTGKVITDVGTGPDDAHGIALQPDGKIVAAGVSTGDTTNDDFAVVRYNTNGSLDKTFDGDGKVTTDIAGNIDDASAISIQPNGKIVTAGYTLNSYDTDFAVIRYNADGTVDSTFDGDGIATTDIGRPLVTESNDLALAVAIQPDGKIVTAGYNASTDPDAQYVDFALIRYVGDATAPFGAHMVALPANTTTLKQTLQWTANDDNTGVKTFDVRTRSAAYNTSSYGAWSNFRSATPLTAGAYTGAGGQTVCFEVRARDVAGNLGAYGPQGCISYPVDDITATATGTWATTIDPHYYGGSARTSSTAGATLNVPVDYRHLGIVVEKCNGCGTVQVLLGATVLATVNTNSAATSYKAIVPVDASTTVKTGTLHIKQTSAGKPVTIDGIAVNLN